MSLEHEFYLIHDTSWRDLFKHAPAQVELAGQGLTVDGLESSEHYERIVLDRDEVITAFEKMVTMSERLGQGDCYLYHCGI